MRLNFYYHFGQRLILNVEFDITLIRWGIKSNLKSEVRNYLNLFEFFHKLDS